MATMYDGVDPAQVPAGAQVYAGYVNGNWQTYEPLKVKFPNAQHVSIAVNTSADADVLDCETGDATAQDAVAWVQRQRARGADPTVYCSRIGAAGYGWPWVQQAFHNAGVAQPHYWIADYTGAPHLVPGSVATQWIDHGGYDESATNGVWPVAGLHSTIPAPSPQATPAAVHITVPGVSVQQVQAHVGVAQDGSWGPLTEAAVKAFQAQHGLAQDGVVGPATWGAMNAPLPVLKQGATGGHVVQLQQRLGIKADGVFGPQTAASVRSFQQQHGLIADGIVGPVTWAALGI